MERTREERMKELRQANHYLDGYPYPDDMAAMSAAWVMQGPFPRDDERRYKVIAAGMEGMGHDAEIRITRDLLRILDKEAALYEKGGRFREGSAIRAVMAKIIEGEPTPVPQAL